jgi:hypothetical protein
MSGAPVNEPVETVVGADLVLDRAPIGTLVLRDHELVVEHATRSALALLPGASLGGAARREISSRLGDALAARIDRVRRSGTASRAPIAADGVHWTVVVESLDARRVALYFMPHRRATEAHKRAETARELLHSLKNSLYGIAVATETLSNTEPRAQVAEILGAIGAAAAEAQHDVDGLHELVLALKAEAKKDV